MKEINPKEVQQKAVETLLQNGIEFTLDISATNIYEKALQRIGLKKRKKKYSIKPITFGNLHRIASLLIPIEISNKNSALDESYKLMESYTYTLSEIIAIAVTNSKHGPSKRLINEIYYNISANESLMLVNIVLTQMDISNFFHTIVLIRGLNIMEMNKTSPQVPGDSLEAL